MCSKLVDSLGASGLNISSSPSLGTFYEKKTLGRDDMFILT